MARSTRRTVLVCGALTALGGCTINPVTGERELALVSATDEVAIGESQYAPSRQMQGGDYVRDPALMRYVNEVGQRVAAVSERALPYEFVVLNSSVPNAWALPGGKIAVNRGLLVELGCEAELAAVLGHEVVHAAARHGALAMQRGLLLQGAVLVAAVATRREDYSGLAVGAAGLGAQLINQRHGRDAELEADLYGMRYMSRTGYDPQAAVSLQETFVRLSESDGRAEQGWLAGLFASHPPSMERVQQNRATAAALPPGGDLGRERYAAATAGLRSAQGAYASYDRGRTALAEGNVAEAESLGREAARLVPDEGHFHALLGDIDFQQDRFADAVSHYQDAIANNDRFFYYRLRKGLAHQRLSQWDEAESNLQASLDLLPTADAYYGLGVLAERRGDRAAALERYSQAATSSGAAGQAAQEAVVRLDLPTNPGRYVTVRTGLDASGMLLLEIANPTRVPIADITLIVRYADPQGALRQVRRVIGEPLAPNGTLRLSTGLGPFTSQQAYEVAIESARAVTQ
jgi:predicted Zn-dependent protease